jgi:hypothetical protein
LSATWVGCKYLVCGEPKGYVLLDQSIPVLIYGFTIILLSF